jgi:hypothetical protein
MDGKRSAAVVLMWGAGTQNAVVCLDMGFWGAGCKVLMWGVFLGRNPQRFHVGFWGERKSAGQA